MIALLLAACLWPACHAGVVIIRDGTPPRHCERVKLPDARGDLRYEARCSGPDRDTAYRACAEAVYLAGGDTLKVTKVGTTSKETIVVGFGWKCSAQQRAD